MSSVIAFISAFVAVALGFAVLFNETRSKAHFAFIGGMAVLALESVCVGIAADEGFDQLTWQNWSLFCGSFLPGLWLLFSFVYARGNAVEFSEYRAFRQGDDPRRLDWKLLARTDRAFLRVTSERTTLPTVLVLDASASMAYPPPSFGKWELACQLTVALASVAHTGGDPVALLIGRDDRVHEVRPSSRRDVVRDVARQLETVTPGGRVPLAPLLTRVKRGARIVIMSDFLDDADLLLRGAAEVASAGSDVVAIHVVAAEELQPPVTPFIAVDPEADDLRRTLGAGARAEYLASFDAWRADLARRWRAAGATYAEAVTDDDAAHIVRRVIRASGDASDRDRQETKR